MDYTVEDFTVFLTAGEYIANFRDTERFLACCRECVNFNRLWACPPLGHNIEEELKSYDNVLIVATKITPFHKNIPVARSGDFIINERKRLESRLRDMEREYGGRAFAFAGTCLYCGDQECSRIYGLPCRHPDLVRPSLEAYGFDIGLTISRLFNFKLLWSSDGFIPAYLTLVSALFHNFPPDKVRFKIH